jgi:DNA-binding NtrC family response regulator
MGRDPRRILIVDPDPWFSGRLKATLASQGYDVEGADGIIQAAERMRDVRFDCLIVDEDLPEMKGHDAVPVLKTICPQAPIIVTAARNSLAVESSIRRQDVFFYHVKTFDMHELQMAVRDALRKVGKGPGGRLPAPGAALPPAE